jgi:hypothetical protein
VKIENIMICIESCLKMRDGRERARESNERD